MRCKFLVLLVAFFLGCAGSDGGDDDGTSPALDASATTDATSNADGDVGLPAHDAAIDSTTDGASDSSAGTDGASESGTDASSDANDGSVATVGLTWPSDRVFPSFAPITALDVVSTSGQTADMATLLVTLQGLVNRTTPRIYVTDGSGASTLWLSEINVPITTIGDPLSLVTKYASEITGGIVIYDDAQIDTLNLACTIAGIRGGIVASPALATTLQAAPYSLPLIADLRANHFASKLDVYKFELANYASEATHRLIVGLTPSITDHLRDYAVATKAMMVWLDPTNAAEKALLGQFLSLLSPNSPYMGWWTSEPDGVKTAATYSVPVYAADWSMNLTVLGGTPRGSNPPHAPAPPKLENKVYVAIFMSDGDNLQEDQGLIPLKWADNNRGNVPMSWTVSPALVDVAPVILRYYQRTATPSDELVSGPSGLGYTYPGMWPAAAFDQYTQLSASYMSTAGLRVATVWNNGADLSQTNAQSYATNMTSLLGLTIQDSTTAQQFIGTKKLPITRMALSYGDSASILESGIDPVVSSFDGSHPVFAAVQGDMNNGAINPSAFHDVQSHYETNTHVVFVRADQFFQLLAQANAPPAHRVFRGDFDGDKKTDSLFYYAGNGDFWLGLSSGQSLTWSNAGNQAGFGNLLDGSHPLYTGDFNGDGKTDLAFYFSGDGNWWLGASNGSALSWSNLGTKSFGNVMDGKHDVRVGDYDGDGKSDFAVYSNADGSWQLGISSGTTLTWKAAGSTSGFGNLLDGSHVLYDGDFDGDGKADVLFFYNGDQNLWLGRSTGTAFAWSEIGNVTSFGNLVDHSHKLLAGDFDGDKKTDLAFYYSGNGDWFVGLSSGTALTWSRFANTGTTENFLDLEHHLATLDVDGDGKLDIVSAVGSTGAWSVGHSSGAAFTWSSAGSTASFGDLADPSRLLFFGDYDGDGKQEPLFYDSASGAWQMSASNGTTFAWHSAGSTSGFGDLTH